jgi:hypothetical protein
LGVGVVGGRGRGRGRDMDMGRCAVRVWVRVSQ